MFGGRVNTQLCDYGFPHKGNGERRREPQRNGEEEPQGLHLAQTRVGPAATRKSEEKGGRGDQHDEPSNEQELGQKVTLDRRNRRDRGDQ